MNWQARITPACAGNTGRLRSTPLAVRGSPPLARGIHLDTGSHRNEPRITPACAGNTNGVQSIPIRVGDHPRLRGEYHLSGQKVQSGKGSPPLARVIHFSANTGKKLGGITPACAGNTLKKSHIYSLFPISTSKFHLVSQTPEMS